jgi:hypothetical protein
MSHEDHKREQERIALREQYKLKKKRRKKNNAKNF